MELFCGFCMFSRAPISSEIVTPRTLKSVTAASYKRTSNKSIALVIFTGCNEVVAKVVFLHVSVILLTGGGLRAGRTPRDQTPPPGTRQTPNPRTRQTPPGPGRHPPGPGRHPPGSRHQHTVNDRPVRILLECILVFVRDFASEWHASKTELFCSFLHFQSRSYFFRNSKVKT